MTATTKAPKRAPSGTANKEKGKTHASWPKGGAESISASKSSSKEKHRDK